MDNENNQFSFANLGDELDLHHFHPRDTALVVNEFLKHAHAGGLKQVVIIHGKGRSMKKKEVLNLLNDNLLVDGISGDSGNWGRTIVFLKT